MNHIIITSAVTICESYFGIKQNCHTWVNRARITSE